MNTGHEGSMATVHANTPRDAISRLEQMIGMAGMPMTVASIRGQIAAAIRVIVQLSRQSDGKRKVMSIAEITVWEFDIIQMQEIFKFVRTGTAPDGTVQGHFQATGVRPRFLDRSGRDGDQNPRLAISIRRSRYRPPCSIVCSPTRSIWSTCSWRCRPGSPVEAVYLLCFSTASYRSSHQPPAACCRRKPPTARAS